MNKDTLRKYRDIQADFKKLRKKYVYEEALRRLQSKYYLSTGRIEQVICMDLSDPDGNIPKQMSIFD